MSFVVICFVFFITYEINSLVIPSINELLNKNYDKQLNYESFNSIPLKWEKIDIEQLNFHNNDNYNKFNDFNGIYYMKLQRFIKKNNEIEIGEFNIYKFDIKSNIATLINGPNSRPQVIYNTEKEASNVKVSNVGGIHGYPTLFKSSPPNHKTSEIAYLTSKFAEQFENYNFNFPIREFDSIRSSEAWLNINCHNHYNNIHHHGGAAWSGVIYCHIPISNNNSNNYNNINNIDDNDTYHQIEGGDLLIKPEPHPSQDDDYKLKDHELDRIRIRISHPPRSASNESNKEIEKYNRYSCSYLKFKPEQGQVILFPSWMYHGVTPLDVKNEEDRNLRRGKRVSVAFNIVAI